MFAKAADIIYSHLQLPLSDIQDESSSRPTPCASVSSENGSASCTESTGSVNICVDHEGTTLLQRYLCLLKYCL